LKNTPFFSDMNWDYLERGLMAPPFLPKVSSRLTSDAQNFENLSTFNRIAMQKGEKSISTQTKEAATADSSRDASVDGGDGASVATSASANGDASPHSRPLGRGDESDVEDDDSSQSETRNLFADFDYVAAYEAIESAGGETIAEEGGEGSEEAEGDEK
jgi:hypothetical protein